MKIGDKLLLETEQNWELKDRTIGTIIDISKNSLDNKNLYHVKWKFPDGTINLIGYFKKDIKSWIRFARKNKELLK